MPTSPAIDSGSDPVDGAHSHGWAATQGVRPTMEDEFILGAAIAPDVHLWGVLDGHGGRMSVELLMKWLPEGMRQAYELDPTLSDATLLDTVETIDKRLCKELSDAGSDDGATALLVIAQGGTSARRVRVMQIGDSQAVLCGAFDVHALCPQHRTDNEAELKRLSSAGAKVQDGRVVGRRRSLAVTRSLGDVDLKTLDNLFGSTSDLSSDSIAPGVIATPEVSEHNISAADELLILGCDGLWDVMSPEDAWELARRKGKKRGAWDLEETARALVQAALTLKTGDNVSVLVLGLKPPRPPAGSSVRPQRAAAASDAARSPEAKAVHTEAAISAPGQEVHPRGGLEPIESKEDAYVSQRGPEIEALLTAALQGCISVQAADPLEFFAEHFASLGRTRAL